MARTTVCLGCGARTSNGSRCTRCGGGTRRHNPAYDTTVWRRIRKRELAAHRARHGDVCPGWRRPPHPALRLTVDHVTPLALGGAVDGPTRVLCDSCNTRVGNHLVPRRRGGGSKT